MRVADIKRQVAAQLRGGAADAQGPGARGAGLSRAFRAVRSAAAAAAATLSSSAAAGGGAEGGAVGESASGKRSPLPSHARAARLRE